MLLEWKYDGVRAQIHISRSAEAGGGWSDQRIGGARVRCLSRHLNDVTVKFRPALEEVVARYASSHLLPPQSLRHARPQVDRRLLVRCRRGDCGSYPNDPGGADNLS